MEKKSNKKVLKVIGLLGLFLLVFGLSYALFTVTLNGTKKVKVKTGKLELQLLDENNQDITDPENAGYVINLDNAVPTSDEDGLQTSAFTFKLKNNGSIDASYTIYLDDVALESGENRLPDSAVRYSLTKNGSSDNPQDLTTIGTNPNRKLDEGIIKKDATNTYTLKIWIDEEAGNEAMGKAFYATLRVEGLQDTSGLKEDTFAYNLYVKDYIGTLTMPVQNGYSKYKYERSGLYKYTDSENTTTYVYRGLPEDNYVSFANQTWRILRIQEDGTVKIITDSPIEYENSEYDNGICQGGCRPFRIIKYNKNNSDHSGEYSGSNVESYINAWYNDEMLEYDDRIVTNAYCSDRYEPVEPSPLRQKMFYGSTYIHLYGIWNRGDIVDGKFMCYPSISCNINDEVNAKAALITADEYVLSGGVGRFMSNEVSNNTYLAKIYEKYWTMSPSMVVLDRTVKSLVYTAGTFNADADYVDNDYIVIGVRPVITLKANTTTASGDGTSEHPYVIS